VKMDARCTALVLAAMNGHIEVLEYLLSKGANAEVADNEGSNSRHWASYGGGAFPVERRENTSRLMQKQKGRNSTTIRRL
jgi:ankyrin repeat protein